MTHRELFNINATQAAMNSVLFIFITINNLSPEFAVILF